MLAFLKRLWCLVVGHRPFTFNQEIPRPSEVLEVDPSGPVRVNAMFRWTPPLTTTLFRYSGQHDKIEFGIGYCERCREPIWILVQHPESMRD